MFRHQKELQFEAKPDRPNPLIEKYLQELIGGQYGEMSVAMQYLSKVGAVVEKKNIKIC